MMLGVIDGHGSPHGAVLATHVRNHFHEVFAAVLSKRLATPMPTSAELVATGAAAGQAVDCISDALLRTFLLMDTVLCSTAASRAPSQARAARLCRETGAVACFAWIGLLHGRSPELRVANVGDTEAVLGYGGRAWCLTRRHVASDPEEVAAVRARGGEVSHGRVMGAIVPSRTLGDCDYKPFLSAVPFLCSHVVDGRTDFLIIASDGLWDLLTHAEAVAETYAFAIRASTKEGLGSGAAAHLIAEAQAKSSADRDNMCVIVVFFRAPAAFVAAPSVHDHVADGSQSSASSLSHGGRETHAANPKREGVDSDKARPPFTGPVKRQHHLQH